MTSYYVATNGNDSNPGTLTQPWRNIQKSISSSSPVVGGDTVYVRQGTYNEQVIVQISGSLNYPISIKAYPNEIPKIDGANVNVVYQSNGWGDGLVHIINQNYIEFYGFDIINSKSCGFYISGCTNIAIDNNYIYRTQSSAIKTDLCSAIDIRYNECSNNDLYPGSQCAQEIISLSATTDAGVSNNYVHDGGAPVNCGGEGILTKDGCSWIYIHNNEVYNVIAVGIYVGEVSGNSDHIYVHSNKIHGIRKRGGHGIDIGSEGTGRIDSVYVYNNLIYDCSMDGIHIPPDQKANTISNIHIFNNTIYNNGLSVSDTMGGIGIQLYTTQPILSNIDVVNNIVFNNRSYQIRGTTTNVTGLNIDSNIVYPYNANDMNGNNYIAKDPLAVSTSNRDFHLQSSSPAIAKGIVQSYFPSPFYDYDGITRPQIPSIGAYDYVGAPPPPTKYKCINGVCTQDPTGTFTENTCGGTCAPPPPPTGCRADQFNIPGFGCQKKNSVYIVVATVGVFALILLKEC